MRFLHTSDWHIGRRLHNQTRFDEMHMFFDWLIKIIRERGVDAVLVAGDIFDNVTPSTEAQRMYYDFLKRANKSHCHVVVTSGNHDPAALLDAPAGLCSALDIHVVGRPARDDLSREVIIFDELVVCAIPFLRDADVRFDLGETDLVDRQKALLGGVRKHYAAVLAKARALAQGRPIVVMGHLFARGGKIVEDDGVRNLVGTLEQIELDIFEPDICYTALGHIHMPQLVRDASSDSNFEGRGIVRYSGSPIPMGFNEAGQEKSVCLVEIENDGRARVDVVPVPEFQRLENIKGDMRAIEARIDELRRESRDLDLGKTIWLGVTYTGSDRSIDVVGHLNNFIGDDSGRLVLVSVRNSAREREVQSRLNNLFGNFVDASMGVALDSLTPDQVFAICLDENHVSNTDGRRDELVRTFNEAWDECERERDNA